MSLPTTGLSAAAAAVVAMVLAMEAAAASEALPDSATEQWRQKVAWQKAQEPAEYRQFVDRFVGVFNSSDIEPLSEHLAPQLMESGRAEKVLGFLNFNKREHGRIEQVRFKYFDREKQRRNSEDLAVYYLRFADGTDWAMRVGVDDRGRLTRFILTDSNYNEDLPLHVSASELSLPFHQGQRWTVLWGGLSADQNYHVVSRAQKNAVDFLIRHPWSKKSHKSDGTENDDYYCFGKPIYSPVKGKVVKVINDVPDNAVGEMNPRDLTGNTVVIRTEADEYVLLAHFKRGSVSVQESQDVAMGARLGLCGNSGNSSEPHLHMHVMDGPELSQATGLEMRFESMRLNRGARAENYSPVRGNTVWKQDP
ncbi:MAG: M23 family metallopeptidase [Xanthomonadales bacterium]|nr:M23 family metallopeptidase [Xanthomonadales bacterium]